MISIVKVCGVDPGATTGLAVFVDGDPILGYEIKSLLNLYITLGMLEPDVVVVEAFLGQRSGAAEASSVFKVIGICEMFVEEHPKVTMVTSNPSILQGKRRPPGISPHIWSASVHALHYIGRKNG